MLIQVMDGEVKETNLEFSVTAEEFAELDAFDLEEPDDDNLHDQCRNGKWSLQDQQEVTGM